MLLVLALSAFVNSLKYIHAKLVTVSFYKYHYVNLLQDKDHNFLYPAVTLWNNLENDVKCSKSLGIFKTKLKLHA